MAMKMMQHIFRLLTAIIVLLSFSPSLLAEVKPVGLVVALRGEVTAANSDGAQRRLAVKSEIYPADTITTGGRGRVQMMFDDNTLISLGSNTNMQISEYRWDPDKKTGEMKTRVSEGVFRIMGGAITQAAPHKFKTDTPAGTIGIRGSMYAGKVDGSSLHLLFQGGKGIYFSNDAGTVSIERPGFGTFVAGPAAAPTKPVRLSNEDLKQLEDVTADVPADSDEGDGSEPDDGEEEQPLQDQEALEEFDETAALEDESPTGKTAAGTIQSNTLASPIDAVKEAANHIRKYVIAGL
jgi:hypothetical protein